MKRKRPLSLELEVFARAGEYRNVPGMEEPEYRLELHLTNRAEREIRFDAVAVSFSSRSESGLQVIMKDTPKGDQGTLIELGRDEVWARSVDTNGYTNDILRDAGGRPVTVSITMKRLAMVVDGPFFGILPPLEDLPFDPSNSWETSAPDRVAGRRLIMGRSS